jgi:hypothetical protein
VIRKKYDLKFKNMEELNSNLKLEKNTGEATELDPKVSLLIIRLAKHAQINMCYAVLPSVPAGREKQRQSRKLPTRSGPARLICGKLPGAVSSPCPAQKPWGWRAR